jgi:preprotein translocase subunit YajC
MRFLFTFLPMGLLTSFSLFAQAPQEASSRGNMIQTLIMIALAFVFFYFILWRPEKKRRKAMEKLRNEMKKGDRVTAMGIVGTVAKIQDQTVILKMIDGNQIEMMKGAITEIQPTVEESPSSS